MNNLLVITPVKDSIETTEQTVRSVMKSNLCCDWEYIVYDDFSVPENSVRLDELSSELGFKVVHISDLTDHPSPNYRLVLQIAQQRALDENRHLVIIESDVTVKVDTLSRLCDMVADESIGIVASVTVDDAGEVNFPYLFARKWDRTNIKTRKRISFCCTLLSNSLLAKYDFHELNPEKSWYDVFISHKSIELGFINIIMMTNEVLHRPHGSRPWKQLKYTNPFKYYWLKYTKGLDKI